MFYGWNFVLNKFSKFLRCPLPLSYKKMTKNKPESRIIWFDGEMTGLDVEHQRFVEVAVVITEADLTEIACYGPVVINQPQEVLKNMSNWCKKTFKKNGLLELIKKSTIYESQVEEELLAFLQQHTPHFKCPLGGNSVSVDRDFIKKYLPKVADHLHYRTIDVSSIKELVKRWYPNLYAEMPEKKMEHRSLGDIYESIEELKYYRDHLFINSLT